MCIYRPSQYDDDYWASCENYDLFLRARHMPDGVEPFPICPFCGTKIKVIEVIYDEKSDDELLSECCGAGPANDEEICPRCGEHCKFTRGDE